VLILQNLTSPPYTFLEGGRAVGFDPELVRALTATIDRKPTDKGTRFEQLIPRPHRRSHRPSYFTTGDSLIVPSDDDR